MGSSESRALKEALDFIAEGECAEVACSPPPDTSSDIGDVNETSVLLPLPEAPLSLQLLQPRRRCLRLVVQGATLDPPQTQLKPLIQAQSPLSTANEARLYEKTQPSTTLHTRAMSSTGPAAPRSPPPLRLPKTAYDASVHLVHERSSFVRTLHIRPPPNYRFTVYVHIYELTSGMLAKHGRKLLGLETSGAYHSALVCYGMEFYFEGGIAIAGAGRTRVGTNYKAVRLGSTAVSFHDFLRWVRARERDTYQLHDYNIKLHNCHHFTRKAAEFLLAERDALPRYLFTTTKELFRTKKGAALCEAMTVAIRGAQYLTARQQLQRVAELQAGVGRLLRGLVAGGVPRQPPKAVVVFHVDDEATCRETLDGLQPYLEQLIDAKRVRPIARDWLAGLTLELARGFDSVDANAAQAFVDVVNEALLRNPLTLWGPPLNALRVALLHHMVLSTVVFHPHLLSVLVFGSREFLRLLPDGKLNLLRVIANLACGSHGAILLSDPHFLNTWVSLVGMGLMEPHPAIVYAAACLAVNIAVSEAVWIMPAMNSNLPGSIGRNRALALATIALYNVSHRTEKELPEPSFNMLLTCLLWFMTSSTSVLKFVMRHPFHPFYTDLHQRAQTAESRALVTIMEQMEAM
ncbi:unnamed protein product [Phytomonas sp. EM1]|nr:unnamed protein product [Phytomonas sp. EM1]|eukprot:CCW62790.1 unnamed protein product [Phytomonas sp. isolate EM1]